MSRKVARVVHRSKVPQGKQILRSRFVLTIKETFEGGVSTGWKYKVKNTGDVPAKFVYFLTSPPGIVRRFD